MHMGVYNSGKQANGTYNFDHIFKDTAYLLEDADIKIMNQETIFVSDNSLLSTFPAFGTPMSMGEAVVDTGFDIVLSATNHTWDKGLRGVSDTLSYWKTCHPEIRLLGIHESPEAFNTIDYVEKNGIRLAMFNYTYGLNNKSATKEASYCVDLLSEERVRKDVAKAKESADFVVVFVHWGTEYEMNALNGDQKKYTGIFLDCGVDAVIGAHPHICQTMEWKTRADGHKMVVYYSLGNFISIFKQKECNLEGMAYLEFRKNGEVKEVREGTVIPLVNHWEYSNDKLGTGVTNGKNFRVYALQDYTDGLGQTHGCLKYDKGKGFSRALMEELAKKLWGDNIKVVDWSTVTPARTAGK